MQRAGLRRLLGLRPAQVGSGFLSPRPRLPRATILSGRRNWSDSLRFLQLPLPSVLLKETATPSGQRSEGPRPAQSLRQWWGVGWAPDPSHEEKVGFLLL